MFHLKGAGEKKKKKHFLFIYYLFYRFSVGGHD